MIRKLLSLLIIVFAATAVFGMGGKPPEKKEGPKYKLKVLKMEFIPVFSATPEAKVKKNLED